jgi:hypothetical protein
MIFVYRRVMGPLFWLAMPLILAKWMVLPREYGDKAPEFRALLRRAIRDGLANNRSATLLEIQAVARNASRPDAGQPIPD